MRRVWQKAERCFDEEGQTEGVVLRVARALAVFRLDGELHERQWVQEQWREATKPLAGPEWGKVHAALAQ